MKVPMKNPDIPFNAHYPCFPGFSLTIILHPGVRIIVILKENVPQIMFDFDSIGLILVSCRLFKVYLLDLVVNTTDVL